MSARQLWMAGIAILLLGGFQLYGLAELSSVPLPTANLTGTLYSEYTMKPLPNTMLEITSERLFEEQPLANQQGWIERQYGTPYRWQIYTDSQGRFQLRGIPAGDYVIQCQARIHTLTPATSPNDWGYGRKVSLRAGETLSMDLWARPYSEFLDSIHPQSVYLPDEPLRVGVRGFLKNDRYQMRLFAIQIEPHNPRCYHVLSSLSQVRYGWWEGIHRWNHYLDNLSPYLTFIEEKTIPVRGRDVEGMFTQYLDLPRLEEGTYLVELRSNSIVRPLLVSVSSVGLISKSAPDQTEVWCTHLRTGQPVSGITISQVKMGTKSDADSALKDQARSDAQGLVRLQPQGTAYLVAQHPRTGRLLQWVGEQTYHDQYPDNRLSQITGALYTERPIYRPGQTIHFKGILRQRTAEGYQLLRAGTPIRLVVDNPSNETILEKTLTLNEFASFHGEFTTQPDDPTGFYTIWAYIGNRIVASNEVPVSAYRKPNLRVEVRSDDELYLSHETVALEIRTEYYFGLPVANTELTVSILRQPVYYQHEGAIIEGDEEYSKSEWGGSDYGTPVYVETHRTDARGRLTLRIPASRLLDIMDATTVPVPFVVRVEAFTQGREAAKGTTRFQIAPSEWLIQYEAGRWFGEVGTPFEYTVRVRDVRTGRPVQATLQWTAGQQLWQGRSQRLVRHASGTVRTNAEGVARIAFTPHRPGDWLIQIETADPRNRVARAEDFVWVIQDAWWADTPSDYGKGLLEVRTQKRFYEPGEQVELAIRSRARDAVFYITLEGDRLYRSQIVRSRGTLTRVALPLTAEQVPSAVVSVCMVYQKRMYQRTVPIRVGWKRSELQISVRTDKARYQPRDPVRAEVRVQDAQGRPVRAELSLAVVDESLYAIREDAPQFIHKAFYTLRWNKVNTEFSAPWLALQGDKGEAETPRRDFPDTAFWLPTLQTDAQGIARAEFRLPDSLTEWRLTAIGHTARTEVGYAKTTVKAAKDLMVRLRLPMWLIEGDRTELSALVSNDTDQARTVLVELRTPENTYTARTTVPARGTQPVRWDYIAKTPGTQQFTVSARAEGTNLSDSEQRSLLVKPAVFYQSVISTQRVAEEATFTLNLPSEARLDLSRLELRTYPNLSALLGDWVDYLLSYEHLCAEQTVSQFLPPALWLRAIEAEGTPVPDEKRRRIMSTVNKGIERLRELENNLGGWTWWGDGEVTPWLTAYVMDGLHQARLAGINVPEYLYLRGMDALRRMVEDGIKRLLVAELPTQGQDNYFYKQLAREVAYGLRVLSELEKKPQSLGADLPTALEKLSQVNDQPTQWDTLIALLNWYPELRREAAVRDLWNRMMQRRTEDGQGIAWAFPEEPDRSWAWQAPEIQALALKALARSEPLAVPLFGSEARYRELQDKTALMLIIQLQNRYRYTSRDVAMGVQALLEYNRSLPPQARRRPPSTLELSVNGQALGTVRVSDERASPVIQDLSRRLRPGENTLQVRAVGATPLVTVVLRYAVPISRAGRPTDVQTRLYLLDERTQEPRLVGANEPIPAGALLCVETQVIFPPRLSWFEYSVLEIPYAGGFAPLDTESFLRTAWWSDNTAQLRDDRAIAYRGLWQRGDKYWLSFLVRAELPGEYTILPAHMWGMYTPYEMHGAPLRVRIVDR
ncbi:MAG: alpha-2-macroglobulin family protein [Fimbriimonadales bacterium]